MNTHYSKSNRISIHKQKKRYLTAQGDIHSNGMYEANLDALGVIQPAAY